MKLLNDAQIIHYASQGMIRPFFKSKIRQFSSGAKAISFGCSGHGYDIRLSSEEILIAKPDRTLDPKNASEDDFYEPEIIEGKNGMYFELPGRAFCLGKTIERFDIPENIFIIAVGKSTNARSGLVANITPIEAGWRGILTLEINNNHQAPVRVYVNEGICQLIFFEVEPAIQGIYSGNYQEQAGTTVSKV